MNHVAVWIMFALLSMGSSCGPDQATQLLETARLEERQNNMAHAKDLYEDIVRRYPDSPAAQTAKTRLDQLAEKSQ
jgi:TolA-binding protein